MPGQPLGGPTVVLCRERCTFGEFDAPEGASNSAALAAARLHALTSAPFRQSGALITRQGRSFGVWWWNAEWVRDQLLAAGLPLTAKILPEPFARAAGSGARVVKATSGYEAQLWRDGFLLADSWRRAPFDDQAWLAFIRLQPVGAEELESESAPHVQAAPFVAASPYRRAVVSDWTPESLGKLGAVAAAVLLVAATTFLLGQTISFNRQADKATAEAQALQAKAAHAAGARTQGQVRDLVALKQAVEYPDPITLVKAAQQIVQPFGYKISVFTADQNHLRFELPQEAAVGVDLLSSELEASPYFTGVHPTLDRTKQRLILDMAVQKQK